MADQTFQTIYSSIRTVRQTVWMLQEQFINHSLLLANESIKAQFRRYASLTPNLIQPYSYGIDVWFKDDIVRRN